MQERIRGVVLRTVKYKETGLIVDLFTERHGRMSFMTSVTHGKRKTGAGAALRRPLNLVEFDADTHSTRRLARPHDVRLYANYADLPFNATKQMVSLFLADFLSATLRSEQADEPLYRFVETSLQWLDEAQGLAVSNFHLYFLLRLTRFVGIEPNVEQSEGRFFDLMAGTYRTSQPPHAHFLPPEEARQLPLLQRMSLSNLHCFRFSRVQRRRILELLNDYYRIHLSPFPELRSIDVLREVFD